MNRSENMRRIKSKDTSIEVKLRKALWNKGYRYRINDKRIFGKPDICFKSKKIAIFCDSEFWHGKYYQEGKYIPKTNKEFWVNKFENNIKRDSEVNEYLTENGWTVLRFWENDINNSLEECIIEIEKYLNTGLDKSRPVIITKK